MAGSRPEMGMSSRPRVDAIDFWRGLVLCTIYINHIPGTAFEALTQKNYGFSDSSEAFVFLSGASIALAYVWRFAAGQGTAAVTLLARRAVKLYGVHLLLSLAAIAIFSAGVFATGSDVLMQEHGRDLFVDDPMAALLGLVSLGHQLGYFNILPMYVVLLAIVAPMLWVGVRRPHLMLGLSVALYALARLSGLNVPTWPMKGAWFFDPFTWQLPMVCGLYASLLTVKAGVPRHPTLIAAASAIVLLGVVVVTDGIWLCPGLSDWVRSWADVDKTVLGLGRIVHFAAVAYLLYALRIANLFRTGFIYAPLCRLGRNSLWIFAVLSIFAAIGQVLTEQFGHSLGLDMLMICGGLLGLYGIATLLEWRRIALAPRRTIG